MKMAKDIKVIREKINEIDQEIKKLWVSRLECSKEVAEYKKENNLPIFDATRENEIIINNSKDINDELVKKHAELMKKYRETTGKIHYKDVKSQYIGCKHCGSKINKDYLTQNHCPICRQDLRPQSVLDSIEKMKLKLVQLQEDIKKEEKKEQEKYKKRAEEHWLVKIEYHV